MGAFARLRYGFGLIRKSPFAFTIRRCPYCGPSLFVWLGPAATDVRCIGCSAGVVQLGIGWALRENFRALGRCDVCELSSRGALVGVSAPESAQCGDVGIFSRRATRHAAQRRALRRCAATHLCERELRSRHAHRSPRTRARRCARDGRAVARASSRWRHDLHGADARGRTHGRARAPARWRDRISSGAGLSPRSCCVPRVSSRSAITGSIFVERLRAAGFVDARILAPSRRLDWLGGLPVIAARKPS